MAKFAIYYIFKLSIRNIVENVAELELNFLSYIELVLC